MYPENKKYRNLWIASCILTFIAVCAMYVTHRAIPFMMDDLWYSTKLSCEEPVRNLRDIVESQVWHYFNWGGRSITHAILQLTLLAGEKAADILNVAVTLILAAVICLVAGIKKNGRMFGMFSAIALLIGMNANWKMSMFWQAGAANYLYITVFILLYLYCYLRETDSTKKLFGITFWIIPLGLLAGWSNENMGPAVWLTSLAVIGIRLHQHVKIPVWMFLGNISCLLGSVMVIIAPGNFVRSAEVEENQYGLLWRCFLRGYAQSKAVCEYLFPTLIVLAAMLVISKCILKLPIGKKNLLLIVGAVLSWGAMVLSPHYPDRASFGTMVMLICVIISCADKIVKERNDLLVPLFFLNTIIWLRGMYFLGEYLAINWGWIR